MADDVAVAVIGAGQAGLAIGYYLAQQGRSFVILDAAPAVGHSWRTRYDSLRLFTPAEYNNLPGLPFPAAPGSYATKDAVADYLSLYATTFALPVRLSTRVTAVDREREGFLVHTDATVYHADQLVIAAGPFQRPYVPAFSTDLASEVCQMHSSEYRNSGQLRPGLVVVVGAGNSGAQIAEELAGERTVYLSMGKRPPYLPQRFMGRDLFWWLHTLGLMGVAADSRLGRRMSQHDPLIGTDLRRLERELHVGMIGRAVAADGRLLATDDGRSVEVANVIWATGFRPDFSWLRVPVVDDRGVPIHTRGVSSAPGLYFLGQPWQRTRGSALLGGVGRDAAYLAEIITEEGKQHE